jgi:polysaccharide biosynthesis transport protein
VLVTSAAPGDGKSTVASNLAAAAATTGNRVLLIEVDLRHPSLARALRIRNSPGLTHVLARDARIEDVIQRVAVLPKELDPRSTKTMDVVVSGPLPPNPTDLVESDRMREIIEAAEREYDLVVIDTPPTAVVPDAIPLVQHVKGVIVVGRLGKSTRDSVMHLKRQLDNLDAPVLGVVVNSLSTRTGGYGYGYGYGYEPDPEQVETSLADAEPDAPGGAPVSAAADTDVVATAVRREARPSGERPAGRPMNGAPRNGTSPHGTAPTSVPSARKGGLVGRLRKR